MLTGNDFIILSSEEAHLLYNALRVRKDKATYGELQNIGILDLVKKMERFLFHEEGEDQPK